MGRAPRRLKQTPKDLAEPITPENFEATMEELYPSNLHKEVYWNQQAPDETLYRWYYEYVKASRKQPAVRNEHANDPVKHAAMVEVDEAFGEELAEDFNTWWYTSGAERFMENGVPRVNVLNGRPDQAEVRREVGILVGIPLNINRDIILEQLNFVLAAYHPKDELRRHEHSTANIKLYPRERSTTTDYGFLLRLWKGVRELRDQGHNVTWWRVYCNAADMQDTLQQLELGNTEDNQLRERFNRAAKKLYSQANRLMTNAIIGHFPRDREND